MTTFIPASLIDPSQDQTYNNLTVSGGTAASLTVSGNLVVQGSISLSQPIIAGGRRLPNLGTIIVNSIVFG
jgi:hypothetical protein